MQAKALLEKIRRCELLKTYRIRIRELEPEYRYNFFKLSKEFELHRSFEKKIKNLLDTRLLLDNRTLTEYNLIPDFNFPEPFPLKLFVRGTLRDYHLYFDYSPLIRGMARNTFDESVVLLFYDEEIIGKYLETMSDVIIEDTLAEISSKATISDIDRMLLLFSTLDKLGRMHFKIEDPEWTGPFQKGWAKLSDLVKRLKENGFPFSYKFDFKAGKREYDEDMWRDLLKLVACGLIYERLTPALLTKGARKAYRERNDFQLTPFGRRYVERYLGKTNNIAKQFEDAIQKEWENAMQMQEQIRNKQKTEEALLDGIANARANGDVKKQRESQTELEKLVQEIRDLKEKIPFMVDYREDVF